MSTQLMAFGLKLCMALVNNDPLFVPTPDTCALLFWQMPVYHDKFGRSPAVQVSCPDNNTGNFCKPAGYVCNALSTYDTFDGSKGTEWFCTREATLKWTDSGIWYWVLK